MKLRSMEEKISYRLFLMGFLGLLFTAALCIFVFHKAFTAQAWTSLEREADLVSAGYDLVQDPQQLSSFVTNDLRITLISQDGSVLFESATDQPMENHLSRPEIRQAMTEGVGRDIRDSQTMGYETYYYAVLLPNGEILRMAQDAETVWSIYDSTLPAIVLSCVALMLAAAVLAALLTRALVSPVLSMTEDLDHIQDNVPYKELVPFAESIHSDRILRENNEKMRQEFTANVSHELKTPLTSISGYAELIETGIAKPEDVPGFAQKIHVEASRMIQLVNDILQLSSLDNASEAGSEPEMETVDLLTVAKDCVERQKLNARRAYIVLSCVALMLAAAVLAALLTRALVSPVLSMTEDLDHIQDNVPYKELVPFAESIHSDRILRENNEKMRQEFTANVSHELKTPLTSISGYAELIETGIAKPEDVPGFAQKIHVEASRMIQLVNDILQLSSLDNASEAGSEPEMETVDLLTVAKDCVERQKLNARRAYISLNCLGESALVHGNRALLDELCQNLCDNAIRYNRPGGKVQITTACSRDGHCTLTVADNGIGIPKEAQSSVFERFYRVDKSRSKATGGTGLGLAIVKHIARIHNARIKLESQVDVGTTITVTFPTAN